MSLFGTDGVRGIPGRTPLTEGEVRRLGRSAAEVFRQRRSGGWSPNGGPPAVVIGRDTRASGPRLARWLTQGLRAAGCSVLDIGVAPTPAVAYLAPRRGALCGAVISASHNPPEFNGIKFFTADGMKAPPSAETAIERRLASCPDPGPRASARALKAPQLTADYLDYLRTTFPATLDLCGLRVVVDGANGAAARIAPKVLAALGAEVHAIGCRPDGSNINRGFGALETDALRREVVRRRAHCGVALDGDADRAVFSDEKGRLLDGDFVIAMAAEHMRESGLLKGGKVVVTVMSNLGLVRYLQSRGIGSVQVPVGDRNVTDALEAGGLALGGESSGHIVFRRFAPTGDGLLTCLQTLAVLRQSGVPMSRFRSLYRVYPHALLNVRVERRIPLEQLPGFERRLRRARAEVKGGRIFVRYSGTEPLLRVLVEGPDAAVVRRVGAELVSAFKKDVGGGTSDGH